MNVPRSSLLTRVPGAELSKPVEPPEDGWFGTPVAWPTEDDDLEARNAMRVVARYLEGCGLPDDRHEAEELLERVLDGVKRVGSSW
jgi:hypothetical protein